MHRILHRTLTAVTLGAVSLSAGAGTIVLSGVSSSPASFASTTPPWEPDANSVGGLVFFNGSGEQITGGNLTDAPLAAYVEGTSEVRANDTKASLWGFLPVLGDAPGQWSGEVLGASTTFPNASAPAPLSNASLPVETGGSHDETVGQLEGDFPNTDTSGDGYAGMYQLRLYTSAAGESLSPTYDSADIAISGSTWSVAYSQSPAVTTTTTLSVSPTTSSHFGATVTLSASVSPSDAVGSVTFLDGSKVLSTKTVTGGVAAFSTTSLTDGTHSLSARFAPSNANTFTTSSSSATNHSISPQPTTVGLKASAASIVAGTILILSATVAPSSAAGTLSFYDGTKKIAAVKATKGAAKFATTKLSIGRHALKVTFTPSSSAADTASSSKVVQVTVKK